ncbi:hypothetical protein AWC38_SpisGene1836 [Stylophora pistillata]|uniref:DUF4708 domain-containing protein n=1 Tax=Stylophora pistillata TaxID=50429 RepID=A0A2B4SVW1_STYPI|nr:hypothetical protein AWC38_SpisGene1836 [Stylophora pistillata]
MNQMRDHEALFCGSLPSFDELMAVKAIIQPKNDDKISTIQPLCCRELIFTEPKVLVSPLMEGRNQLFLITPKPTSESPRFQKLLQRLNIQIAEPVTLTRNVFQFCFSFTMRQKLAPWWNKAGEFLVQGRDFMLENSKLNAISLEVTITDKISIGLQPFSLKLTPCKPEHFTASVKALEEFQSNQETRISDIAISDDLCFVLPRDISMRMQTVCGAPLTFTSSPLYPTSSLKLASHANHSNLTKKTPPQFNQCRPFTVQGTNTLEDTRKQVVTSSSSRLVSSQPTSYNPVVQPSTKSSGSPFPHLPLSPYVPCFTKNSSVSSIYHDSDLITASSNSVSRFTGTRITPMFSRKRVPSHGKEQHTGNNEKGHKTDLRGGCTPRATTVLSGVPSIYHADKPQNNLLSNSSLISRQAKMRKTVGNESGNKTTRLSRTLLESRNIHAEERRSMSDAANEDIGESVLSQIWAIENSPTELFDGASFSSRDISFGHSSRHSCQVSRSLPQTRPGLVITQASKRRNIAASPTDTSSCGSSSSSVTENAGPGTSPCLLNKPRSSPVQINDLPNEGMPSKGLKSKRKLQENVDVREMAIKQQLHKVNMVTLIDWLKKRGVPVKSKDKKEELANKVKGYISMIVHEQ